jgi:hypothetical protein
MNNQKAKRGGGSKEGGKNKIKKKGGKLICGVAEESPAFFTLKISFAIFNCLGKGNITFGAFRGYVGGNSERLGAFLLSFALGYCSRPCNISLVIISRVSIWSLYWGYLLRHFAHA